MSDLQDIAARLRTLAASTDPVVSNVTASARKLKSIAAEVESLKRAGVDVGQLPAALASAIGSAAMAEKCVHLIRAEGVAWADALAAREGAGTVTPARTSTPPQSATKKHSWDENLHTFFSPEANAEAIKMMFSPAANRMDLKALVSAEIAKVWLPEVVERISAGLVGEGAAHVLSEIVSTLFELRETGTNGTWIQASTAQLLDSLHRRRNRE